VAILLFAFVAIVAGMYSLCNRVGGYVTPKENSVEVVKKVDEVSTTTPTTVLTTVPTSMKNQYLDLVVLFYFKRQTSL